MRKWCIKKPEHSERYEIWEYVDKYEDIEPGLWYIRDACREHGAENTLPVLINSCGGYHSIDPNSPEIVKIIESETKPCLPIETVYPVNSDNFHCGYIAPDGTTYSCGYMEHLHLADRLYKELTGEEPECYQDTEDWLEDEKGYMRIDGRGRYNFYYQRHMTDAQAKVCLDKNLRVYGDD